MNQRDRLIISYQISHHTMMEDDEKQINTSHDPYVRLGMEDWIFFFFFFPEHFVFSILFHHMVTRYIPKMW